MNASAPDPDHSSPRGRRVVRLLALVALALVVYLILSASNDPFPSPVRQIAGGLLIAMLLAGNISRWYAWSAMVPRSSIFPRVIWTTFVLILVYMVFRLTYFDPLPGSLGTALSFVGFPLLLALITWSIAKSEDEVRRAAIFEGFAWGGLVALSTIYVCIVAVRSSPSLADWLQAQALAASGGLNPISFGFVLGALFSMLVVWFSFIMSWALWWKRKQ